MNATRLAFGHLVVPGSPYVNEEREFSRYINRKQDKENPLLLFDLYQSYLENKLHNTEVYEGAYKYLDFKPDHLLGLTVSDPDTLKQIELSLAGNDREQLFEYSMSSTDPSLQICSIWIIMICYMPVLISITIFLRNILIS